MLDVCLLGTGGMQPLPGRRLSATLVRAGGDMALIDCGEGTQVAVRERGWGLRHINAILLTHMHADHVLGLPGLLLTLANGGKEGDDTLTISAHERGQLGRRTRVGGQHEAHAAPLRPAHLVGQDSASFDLNRLAVLQLAPQGQRDAQRAGAVGIEAGSAGDRQGVGQARNLVVERDTTGLDAVHAIQRESLAALQHDRTQSKR